MASIFVLDRFYFSPKLYFARFAHFCLSNHVSKSSTLFFLNTCNEYLISTNVCYDCMSIVRNTSSKKGIAVQRSASSTSHRWLKKHIFTARWKTLPPANKWFGLAIVLLALFLLY